VLEAFKAYDIRGRVPDQLNSVLAYRVGLAYAELYTPACVALGRDVRHSSQSLQQALALGLVAGGADVLDLGLCGTEEVYWAAQQPGVDGGIEVTASHNPIDHNGLKLVRAGARPVSGDSGLEEIRARVAAMSEAPPSAAPKMIATSFRQSYVEHLLGYLRGRRLRPLRIVLNAGNGAIGPLLDTLLPALPFELIPVHARPDGSFPNGIPNPLLPENRGATTAAVLEHQADFGVAWDGDFDRCFFFDERGDFIEGYYIVGLLAQALLSVEPGARIIHDPRLTWNTQDIVRAHGGVAVQSKTGHAFIKERMRLENALYGGEMSAHHYFRDFGYCDNGNIPWLLVAALVSEAKAPLSSLVSERQCLYPVSGEINRRVHSVKQALETVERRYAGQGGAADYTDGLSLEFADWRFNLRGSNTEPLLRLNVESRGDAALVRGRTAELLALIEGDA